MKEKDRQMLERFANALGDVRHTIQIQQAEQDEAARESEREERIAAENLRQDMAYHEQLQLRAERNRWLEEVYGKEWRNELYGNI